MAYNEKLAERIRAAIGRHEGVSEKHMFGGLSFLVDGKMVAGVVKDNIVVRANPDDAEALLKQKGVRPMDFTGRPMKGFLYLSPDAYPSDTVLERWLDQSIRFVSTLPKRKQV